MYEMDEKCRKCKNNGTAICNRCDAFYDEFDPIDTSELKPCPFCGGEETQSAFCITDDDWKGNFVVGNRWDNPELLKNYRRAEEGGKQMILYHVTTQNKARIYGASGCIYKPVRGFTTLQAAMTWAIKVGRTVIYQVVGEPAYKLPDHHNTYGEAWWIDENIPTERIKCVFSANKDA